MHNARLSGHAASSDCSSADHVEPMARPPASQPVISQRAYRYAVILYAAVLAAGSLQPMRPAGFHHSQGHGLLHLVCFAGLALLANRAFPGRRSLPWIAPASIVFGATLEWLQTFGSHDPMEWIDVRDDAVGVAVGTVVVLLWQPEV